jgi:two-component system response regulator QseB
VDRFDREPAREICVVTSPGTRRRLLLVEDDRELAGLLDRVLAAEGYDFDVLVVDRGLPAVEGLDLIERLRNRGVATPTLVLSATASTQDRVNGLDAGAEDYLAKPFDIS